MTCRPVPVLLLAWLAFDLAHLRLLDKGRLEQEFIAPAVVHGAVHGWALAGG